MAKIVESGHRRVYVLPVDLVARIVAFQEEMGISSEVEAVRRLLDDALRIRDGWESIVDRFVDRVATDPKRLSLATSEILVGHPLMKSTTILRSGVSFELITGERITLDAAGFAAGEDADGQNLTYKQKR